MNSSKSDRFLVLQLAFGHEVCGVFSRRTAQAARKSDCVVIKQDLPAYDMRGNEINYQKCQSCGKYSREVDPINHWCRACHKWLGFPYRARSISVDFDVTKDVLRLPFWWSDRKALAYAEKYGFKMQGVRVRHRADGGDCTGDWFCGQPVLRRKGLWIEVTQTWCMDI